MYSWLIVIISSVALLACASEHNVYQNSAKYSQSVRLDGSRSVEPSNLRNPKGPTSKLAQ